MDGASSERHDVTDEPPRVEKDRFTSLDTLALARELRALGRCHVDKAFDAGPGAYSLTLRSAEGGRQELRLVPGRYAALGPVAPDHPESPGPLARELRRLLAAAVITDVAEPAGERYLEVVLRRGDSPDPLRLAVEFFGAGNVVVARGANIAAAAHSRQWAHRAVRVGAPYAPPPSRGDPWKRTEAELQVALAASRTDRASTLAARLAFGGPIAEELLARTGLAAGVPATDEPARAAREIHHAVAALLVEVGERPKGYLYERDGVPVDVEPFRSRRWAAITDLRESEFPTFSAAADRFFRASLPVPRAPEEDKRVAARAELERQRAQQQSAIEAMAVGVAEATAQAEAIYANYAVAEAARQLAATASDPPEFVEVQLGDRRVPLSVRRPLEQSARLLYEEAKRGQGKIAGARAALDETARHLAEMVVPEPAATGAAAATTAKRRAFWFESFRWFQTSEGLIAIAGRDAASNERVVKRYLRPGDVYLHADLQGAASVILKRAEAGSGEIGEESRRQAAQFAVVYSKAWRAGLASASAFWVTPEQVSKAPESGEFVARGAFVIHGTKTFFRDLPMEIGVGEVEVQGATRWSAAPPDALRSRGRLRMILIPGELRDRPALEVELARELSVSRSLLQSLLPAGGLAIRRT